MTKLLPLLLLLAGAAGAQTPAQDVDAALKAKVEAARRTSPEPR